MKEVGGVGPTKAWAGKQSDWPYDGHRYSQSDDEPLNDLPVCCQLWPFGFLMCDHAGQPVGQYAHDISYHR